jgi:hypothetical protein
MKLIVAFVFLSFSNILFSQDKKENSGVVIIKDKKIDDLIKNKSNVRRVSTAGYRVQLFFSTDKDKVNEIRMKFIKKYPKMETYITFDAPNYILRVGDFTEKNDAERFKKEIFREYPENFIIKTAINVPNDDEDDWDSKKEDENDSENTQKKDVVIPKKP